MLESIGFKALNTGCPTLWKLTPEWCEQIPRNKAENVIFSLSGYNNQKNRQQDEKLLEILKRNYKQLIFWCQTSVDEPYLDSFPETEGIQRIYSLKQYAELLQIIDECDPKAFVITTDATDMHGEGFTYGFRL